MSLARPLEGEAVDAEGAAVSQVSQTRPSLLGRGLYHDPEETAGSPIRALRPALPHSLREPAYRGGWLKGDTTSRRGSSGYRRRKQ